MSNVVTDGHVQYKASLELHMKLHMGGSIFHYQLTDYPGIFVTNSRDTSRAPTIRAVHFNNVEYATIHDAILAWKERKNANKPMQRM